MSAFSPDGKILVANSGKNFRMWDTATGKELEARPGTGADPVMTISPDGHHLVEAIGPTAAFASGTWPRAAAPPVRAEGEERYMRNLAFTDNGKTVAAAHYKGLVQFWDVASGEERRTVQLHDPDHPHQDGYRYFYQVYVAPNGKQMSSLERIMGREEATRVAFGTRRQRSRCSNISFPARCDNVRGWQTAKRWALPLQDGLTLIEAPGGAVRFRIADVARGSVLAASPDDRLLASAPGEGGQAGRRRQGRRAGRLGGGDGQTKSSASLQTRRRTSLWAPDNRLLVTTDEGFHARVGLGDRQERRQWPLPVAMTDSWGRTLSIAWPSRRMPAGVHGFGGRNHSRLGLDAGAAPRGALVEAPSAKDIAAWWDELASPDAARAYAALWRLSEAPDAAVVSFFRRHVRAAVDTDLATARQHIAELNSDKFDVRDKAFKALQSLSHTATPALRQALENNPPLEVRRRVESLLPECPISRSRRLSSARVRAIDVLEHLASKEATRLLTELAAGLPHAAQTRKRGRRWNVCLAGPVILKSRAGRRKQPGGNMASRPQGKRPTNKSAEYRRLVEQSMEELRLKTAGHDGVWHLGECDWDVDQDAGTLIFTRAGGLTATCSVQIIGTYNTDDGTWLWGWDHPSVDPPLQEHAKRLRQYGEEHGIAALTTRKLECDEAEAWSSPPWRASCATPKAATADRRAAP